VAEPAPRTKFLGMDTTHLRQRLFLWTIVHLGIRDCSPRQLLRWWLLLGGAIAVLLGPLSVLGVADGDPGSGLLAAIVGVVLVLGVVIGVTAAADLRSPVTVEGRVTAFERLWIKGTYARRTKRYQYRVTLDQGTGDERIFRAADETHLRLSEGDLVRAHVGPRLRWIFDVEVVEGDRA
jgi:hypothetical protein